MAEQLFHVMVGPVLVLAGEIQVDIRHLVPLETEEHLERNIKPVFCQRGAAVRTVLVRQVHSHMVHAFIHVEKALPAVDAAVMRRQRVHLGNSAHARHQARSDAAPASDEVSVLQGAGNQLLGNCVQRAVAVSDNGFQFLFQPRLDDLRQRIAVQFLRGIPGHFLDHILREIPVRLEGILPFGMLRKQLDFLHHLRDLPRIVNHDLPGFFLAEIGKLQ